MLRYSIKRMSLTMAAFLAFTSPSLAQVMDLPMRETDRPRTTDSVPHVQLGVEPVPELVQDMLDHVETFPGVRLGATRVSLPGAIGFQLDADLPLANPQAIVGGGEFAHVHPDGSLHASLDPAVAREAVRQGWAIPHPWADQRPGWEGFVMIYTPLTKQELDVVLQLIENSYAYVTGQSAT
ncbi:luciferase domain-containing protein [Octadecabacter ascidiaceicola]|uniref:Luciferase domain-containing protein n=1 Tax=Octadecabacter ascidiaceicola TaxID=1655543 RepID=A0A238K3Q3_9RHOB|nr:luciferase family protein [Octadecabacter ascidiaceicola]SMX36732.1 hypothetical protein OCA8868_01074 [Octadecabacter ascidiaceicola]